MSGENCTGVVAEEDAATVSIAVFILAALLTGLGILAALAFIVFNIKYRNLRLIKMGSPRINVLILVGCVLSYLSALLWGMDAFLHTDAVGMVLVACRFRVWLLNYGFSLAYGGMAAKAWRVNKIFHSAPSQRVVIKDKVLLYILIGLLVMDTVLAAMWQGISSSHAMRLHYQVRQTPLGGAPKQSLVETHSYYACVGQQRAAWLGVFGAYKAGVLVYGVFLAWSTPRGILPAMNDAGCIVSSCIAVLLSGLVSVGAAWSLSPWPSATCFLGVLSVWSAATLIQAGLTVPKIKMWRSQTESSPTSPQIFSPRQNLAEDELQRLNLENMQLRHHLIQKEETMVTLRHNISSARFKLNQLLIDGNNNSPAHQAATENISTDIEQVGIQLCYDPREQGLEQQSLQNLRGGLRQPAGALCLQQCGEDSQASSECSPNSTQISHSSECPATCRGRYHLPDLKGHAPGQPAANHTQGTRKNRTKDPGKLGDAMSETYPQGQGSTNARNPTTMGLTFPGNKSDESLSQLALSYLSVSSGSKVKPLAPSIRLQNGSVLKDYGPLETHIEQPQTTNALGHAHREMKKQSNVTRPRKTLAKDKTRTSGVITNGSECVDETRGAIDTNTRRQAHGKEEPIDIRNAHLGATTLQSCHQLAADPLDPQSGSAEFVDPEIPQGASHTHHTGAHMAHKTRVRQTRTDANGVSASSEAPTTRTRPVVRSKSTFRGMKKRRQRKLKRDEFTSVDNTSDSLSDVTNMSHLKTYLLGIDQDLNSAEQSSAVNVGECSVISTDEVAAASKDTTHEFTKDLNALPYIKPIATPRRSSGANGTTDVRGDSAHSSPVPRTRANGHVRYSLPTTELEESIITSYDLDRDSDTYSYISNGVSVSSAKYSVTNSEYMDETGKPQSAKSVKGKSRNAAAKRRRSRTENGKTASGNLNGSLKNDELYPDDENSSRRRHSHSAKAPKSKSKTRRKSEASSNQDNEESVTIEVPNGGGTFV